MNNDLVKRLRGLACPECGLPSTHNYFNEAADEIERLQLIVDARDIQIRRLAWEMYALETANE